MPTIATNGVELAYRIDGDGPETLVLVNGLADTKETWEAQIPAFAERYRVLTYDNRGVGESSTPPGPYTTRQMADDLAGLADALELERFHLLGVSMGGMIAQEYAIAHAGRLLSASFCCTYSCPGPFCLRMFACWRDLVPHLGVGFTQREVLLWAFTTGFFEEREAELVEIEAFMAENSQPADGYLAQLHSIETHDTRGRLVASLTPSRRHARRTHSRSPSASVFPSASTPSSPSSSNESTSPRTRRDQASRAEPRAEGPPSGIAEGEDVTHAPAASSSAARMTARTIFW